jgi:hypothetical protein
VRVDAFAIRLRPRSNIEAADLGVRLCQASARSVFSCHLLVLLPLAALALASYEIAGWLPITVLWCAKPWLDRTILFTLSRAAFGQATRPSDVWREQRQVWWSQLLLTWTLRRLSPWRSFTQPVYQLEGLRGTELRARVQRIRTGRTRAAAGVSSAFGFAETALLVSFASLTVWFAPKGYAPTLMGLLSGASTDWVELALSFGYAAVIGFVEPFYVAAGFAMYLNRRAELEAWDIEQEFRRAFGG